MTSESQKELHLSPLCSNWLVEIVQHLLSQHLLQAGGVAASSAPWTTWPPHWCEASRVSGVVPWPSVTAAWAVPGLPGFVWLAHPPVFLLL